MNADAEAIDRLEIAYIEIEDEREKPNQRTGLENVAKALSGGKEEDNQNKIILQVHFNPTSLDFRAGKEKRRNKEKASIERKENSDVDKADISLEDNEVAVSVDLIFDRSMEEKGSVKDETEMLMVTMWNPYVRIVGFYWGEIYFRGRIQSVDVEYSMFNQEGNPVRSRISLSVNVMDMKI